MSVVELNNHSTKSWSFGQSFLHTSCRHKKYGASPGETGKGEREIPRFRSG
jgi:hypothetical protein